jgi:hypothetical protein
MEGEFQRTYLNNKVTKEKFYKACGAVRTLRIIGVIGEGFLHTIIDESSPIEFSYGIPEEALAKGRSYSKGGFGFIGLQSIGDSELVDRVLQEYNFIPTSSLASPDIFNR